jgi:uncharacterized protein (TIGR00299 family) protein
VAKTLYFDCFSGASGDMILGALLDLGLPIDALRRALGSLAIEYGEVTAERVTRAGVAAAKFRVIEKPGEPDGRGQHGHHHLTHIVAAIRRSALTAGSQDRAIQLFERLAGAEAAIHNTPIERVHLHEVGALDSIIDIVGAVYGFEWFGIDDIVSSPLNVGGGTVTCAHGVFPVPAPATARLLLNVPVYGNGASELVTPTGALLVTSYAREFGPLPAMRLERVGYGAGDRDPKETPNVLRLVIGERAAAAAAERIVTIECEIDDMNPQLFGPLMDRLSEAGALDVYYAAVQMKKNRPGTLVTVIAHPATREAIAAVLFAHTTTIGVRYQEMLRDRLDREIQSVETPVGPIRFKVATRDGRVLNAAAEFDDCARIASERGVPIKDVQAIATRAWVDTRDARPRTQD